MESLRASSLVSLLALLAIGCGAEDEPAAAAGRQVPTIASDAVSNYAELVHASYQDSLSTARALEAAATAMVTTPNAATYSAVQEAWRAAREPYLQTEVYRFYGGPIDDDKDGPEGLLNAWPLDEGHIDYVEGEPNAGIINDPQRMISAATLMAANLNPGETDVATGYHAIEFLLWGQDLNEDGPGERSFTDYARNAASTRANSERRAEYLTTAAKLMLVHLSALVGEWAPGDSNNYRSTFEAADPEEALSRILSGMIILSGFELSQERLSAALDAQDQEEEHSCFSDNTHRDMVQDVQGIQNVWLGSYQSLLGARVSGTSVREVIAAGDSALADAITTKIGESLSLAKGLHVPFDQEIATGNAAGNARVEALIDSLADQRDLLGQAFQLYGLNRIPDPI